MIVWPPGSRLGGQTLFRKPTGLEPFFSRVGEDDLAIGRRRVAASKLLRVPVKSGAGNGRQNRRDQLERGGLDP